MKEGYVSQDKAPWLRYALEKRVITLITLVPLIILGLLIAPLQPVLVFLLHFTRYELTQMVTMRSLLENVFFIPCWESFSS